MSGMDEADMAARQMSDALEERLHRIRELHRPHWRDPLGQSGQVWLACHGCDAGDYAEGPALWPCRTAKIVYTAKEIAIREPQIPECTHDHGTRRDGTPIRPQAVFVRPRGGQLIAARWNCDHVQPVPVEPVDPWDS
jgi:hypothetical protein